MEDKKEAKDNTNLEIKEDNLKQEILKMSEISLWLDTYDDIFSDFDPRQFSQRALSVDFLDEIKRASREKATGQIELKFLIPEKDRENDVELQIKRRLKEHFKKHADMLNKEERKTIARAIFFIFFGFAMLIFASYISSLDLEGFFYAAIPVFLEPAGWFTFWFSLEQIFDRFKEKKPEEEFYARMSKAEISFISY